jgi:glycosyltransferase involved in cell wall biosynthesis
MQKKTDNIELSIVIPCLNEADTLAICIDKAQTALRENKISGEVLIADNGSDDGSQEIATSRGARVVDVPQKGYGHALMGGINAAKGKFCIMGDADDSYDFLEIPKFITELRKGAELVQGCRFPWGGGKIEKGAMPFTHKYFGNPLFSVLTRLWFGAPIHDVYCGLRGFTKKLFIKLDLRCTGMEFATEMIIKSSLSKAKISEVPITLHPDKRKAHKPHLNTFADGWRTLRFFLMMSPRWLFLIPGIFLCLLGAIGYTLALPSTKIGTVTFEAHTLLFASLFILCGCQAIFFAILTKTFAMNEGLIPADKHFVNFFKIINLEKGLFVGTCLIVFGIALLLWAINLWRLADFQELNYAYTMKIVIPGVTLTALGFQIILFGFFTSILGMQRK